MNQVAEKGPRVDEFVENPRKALWSLALPMMVGMMVQTIYSVVDMIFVGRVGGDALTALAFNVPLVFFGLGMVFGLGSGVTAVVAQYIGSGDKRNADNSAEHGIVIGVILGVVFTGAGLTWGKSLLAALGAPPHIVPLAWSYFRVIAVGYIFMVSSIFFRSILSGEGDMKTPLIIQGGGTILNIILDPIFIFGLEMGVEGAAVATVLSQASVSLVFAYFMLVKKRAYITFALKDFAFSRVVLGKILKVGIPASFSMLIMSMGGGVFNKILVSFSSDAVAGYQVGMRIDHVYLMPLISIATSLVTLVGMFYGAKRLDLVRAITQYAISRGILIGLVAGSLFFAFAEPLVSVFTQDPEIYQTGVQYLKYFVFAYPFIAVGMIGGRMLQGLGFGIPMLVLTFLRVVLISVVLAYTFVFVAGKPVQWVWISQVIAVICSAGIALLWLRSSLRRLERGDVRKVKGVPHGVVSSDPLRQAQEV
ncbi:MAG: MATE family efflux transporter [Candidatus Neomarinimicrobiota bacterium]